MKKQVLTPMAATMPDQSFKITELTTAEDVRTYLSFLSTILQECVNEGSSVGFLVPFSPAEAEAYWLSLLPAIKNHTVHLFILTSSTSALSPAPVLGTIQLSTLTKATHAHRAEVQKLLVLPSARKMGLGRRLMGFIESFAKGIGKEVLVLDTATESKARDMYARLGWEEWGTCKAYVFFLRSRCRAWLI